MNKKGFTLIELLAVIVILAVIALIAVPIILNVIESAKKGAIKDSAHGILESANVYVASNLKEGVKTNLKFTCENNKCSTSDGKTINFKGKVEHGTLIIDSKGNALVCVDDGDYYALKNVDEKDVINGEGTCGEYEEVNGEFIIHNMTAERIKEIEEELDRYKAFYGTELSKRFSYTGAPQEFTAPISGYYKLETWGAQGGSYSTYAGGYGGYSSGEVYLEQGTTIYIYVGGAGSAAAASNTGGYNGGGTTTSSSYVKGSGGGATHISTQNKLLSALSSSTSDVLIVAGGGGGAVNYGSQSGRGGSGGGVIAPSGTCDNSSVYIGTGGTSSTGGSYSNNYVGTFGQGGNQQSGGSYGGAGGGGWYGGGGGCCNGGGGGGGSGHIGNTLREKVMYCYNCSEETTDLDNLTISTTGSNTLADKVACPSGYSAEPVSKCAKSGNGYAKITFVSVD